MSTITSPSSSGARPIWEVPRRTSRVPNWLLCAPFLSMHMACLAVFLTGVDVTALVLCGAAYFIRMFGITAGYHRYFAHRAYKTSRLGQFVLACLGCSAMQRGPLWWASNHREHHHHSDMPADPHSPHQTTFWWAHFGWMLAEDHADTPWEQIRDWAVYPELRWLDRNHWLPGVGLAAVCWLIGGWSGLAWGFFVSTVLVYHAVFAINSLSHLIGKRRYETNDESRNNVVLAVLTLGEGWHNNHHHYQSSANQGFFWWEVDISYYAIRMLSWFGLVWDVRKPGAKALTHRLIQPTQAPASETVPTGAGPGGWQDGPGLLQAPQVANEALRHA